MFSTWENAKPNWRNRVETLISGKIVSFIPLENYNGTKNKQFLMAYKDEANQMHLKIQGYWSSSQEENPILVKETFSGGMFQINPDGYTQHEFLITNGKVKGRYDTPYNTKYKENENNLDNTPEWWLWLPSNIFLIETNGEKTDPCEICPDECECNPNGQIAIDFNTTTDDAVIVWILDPVTGDWIAIVEKTDGGHEGCSTYHVIYNAVTCQCEEEESTNTEEVDDAITDINNNTITIDTDAGGGSNSTTGWEEVLDQLLNSVNTGGGSGNNVPIPFECFEQEGMEDAFMVGLGSIDAS